MAATPPNARDLFLAALERPPGERPAYLEAACGGDAALRGRVQALLRAHDEPGAFLSEASPPGPEATQGPVPGDAGGHRAARGRNASGPSAVDPLGQIADEFVQAFRQGQGPAVEEFARRYPAHAEALRDLLPALALMEQAKAADATEPPADGAAGAVIAGRYTLLQRLGEGGMGEVWVARQTEPVKRQVALKLIKAGMDSRAVLARFEGERQALALMDHPHIARVLDGGLTAQRRPFFALELVHGLPLTRFCDEARLGIRERLELFAAVCQAVQHAHQKGVVHRDLKPSNILVTLVDGRPVPKVIDFGVAKAVGGKLREESPSTQFGAVVGTLEYMAPEQAGYSGSDVDTRADIYSLGVLLYELLTGLLPLDARRLREAALDEVLRVIREEEPPAPSARLSAEAALPSLAAARQVEPRRLLGLLRGELDWVVLRCLEKQRERRYATASALARDVQRYLADEPVEARPPSAGYRLRKFVRRHPLELALAGALALLLVGGVAVAWWQSEQAGARRETDLRRRLEDERRGAADRARRGRNAEAVAALLGQCEQALRAFDAAKAQVALDAARKRSTEGGAESLAERLSRLAADLALLRELDAVDQFHWTWADNQFPDPAVAATRTREALRRFGADPDAVPVGEAAARVSASVVRERIVTALDRRLRQERTVGLRAVLRRVDADPYRDAVRDATLARDPAKLVELVKQDAALEQPPGFAAFLGEIRDIKVERRRQLLQAAVSRRPKDLGLLMTLGWTYPFNQQDGADERLRWYQAAVAAAPGNAAGLNNLGAALYDKGQLDEAIACFRKAIDLDPKLAYAHSNLGSALNRKGQLDEAIAACRKAIALDPKRGGLYSNLGAALVAKGEVDEAIACSKKAIACYEQAVALDPKHALAHYNLGTLFLDKKADYDAAIACFQKAVALDPNFALAHNNLGFALAGKGKVDAAITCYQKAIALDPNFALAHNSLGAALAGKGKVDAAITCFKKAIALDPNFALAHNNLAQALHKTGQIDGAVASYRKALALDPNLPGVHALLDLALRQAARAHYNLGVALHDKGQVDEAIACFREATELDPKFADGHAWLGQALLGRGRYAEARAALARALELVSETDPHRAAMSQLLQTCQRLGKLQGRFPRLLEGEDKAASAQESLDVALMCQHQRRNAAAARFAAAAFAADTKLADDLEAAHRYNAACYAALAAAGEGKDATKLDDKERGRLRKQALDWLRADLAGYQKRGESSQSADLSFVLRRLRHWQRDADLAGLRDKAALAKLPAAERAACAKLWADVTALLKRAKPNNK
jgi:tetratricopeptide (TPR) repeat protein